jgi:hypothetical protein
MKDLQILIRDIFEKQNALTHSLDGYKAQFKTPLDKGNFLFNIPSEQLNSSEIVNLVADSLQMLEVQELIEQIDLFDILKLYELTLTNNKYNIDFFNDYISYKINVLDETTDAALELGDYIETITEKINNLKQMLATIEAR